MEALHEMNAGDSDLVLSDVNMPQRDGVTLAHCLCTSVQTVQWC